jgi:hypothetical protein
MQHPWPRIVGDKADSRTITELASGHGITYDRVGIVISATSSTSDDREGVLRTTFYQYIRYVWMIC